MHLKVLIRLIRFKKKVTSLTLSLSLSSSSPHCLCLPRTAFGLTELVCLALLDDFQLELTSNSISLMAILPV